MLDRLAVDPARRRVRLCRSARRARRPASSSSSPLVDDGVTSPHEHRARYRRRIDPRPSSIADHVASTLHARSTSVLAVIHLIPSSAKPPGSSAATWSREWCRIGGIECFEPPRGRRPTRARRHRAETPQREPGVAHGERSSNQNRDPEQPTISPSTVNVRRRSPELLLQLVGHELDLFGGQLAEPSWRHATECVSGQRQPLDSLVLHAPFHRVQLGHVETGA